MHGATPFRFDGTKIATHKVFLLLQIAALNASPVEQGTKTAFPRTWKRECAYLHSSLPHNCKFSTIPSH